MFIEPRWMRIAWRELGVDEVPGPADNPRIVEYHKACDDELTHDSVPWCSSLVNHCMKEAGEVRTKSRAARSWLEWGVEISEPIYGCVCVLWRDAPGSWKGHVGFFIGIAGADVILLGGNQNNEVSVRRYPQERVLGYRWI
jgi:uncharacterized protein (TIGR02594 family)